MASMSSNRTWITVCNFEDQSIDTVVMTQALQAVQRPDELLDEMLRIGKEAIVTFPNFGYWKTRFYLLLKGRMPMSDTCRTTGTTRRTFICAPSATLKFCAVKKAYVYLIKP